MPGRDERAEVAEPAELSVQLAREPFVPAGRVELGAVLVAEEVTTGAITSLDTRPLRPDRFARASSPSERLGLVI